MKEALLGKAYVPVGNLGKDGFITEDVKALLYSDRLIIEHPNGNVVLTKTQKDKLKKLLEEG